MASGTTTAPAKGAGRRSAAESDNGAKTVQYVVLEQVKAVKHFPAVEGEEQRKPEDVVAWTPVLNPKNGNVKVFTAAKADEAIEQHTGKGKGTVVGTWKAVTVRTWKGVVTTKPPKPVLEDDREASDDL